MAEVKVCSKCGSSIPMPDIIAGKAKLVSGQLLCGQCAEGGAAAVETPAPASQPVPAAPAPQPTGDGPGLISLPDDPVEPLAIGKPVADEEHTEIIARGMQQRAEVQYSRQPHVSGTGPIRVKTFDTKLTRAAMELMDEQINMWLDETGYEVKLVTTTIGDVQAKTTEQHLIVNIWY
ncbi:MAG: hypothetical protein JXL80_12650 [Planctomycetes bacterium]|nr:hypothetical protein [Planctomycetota bacterium]